MPSPTPTYTPPEAFMSNVSIPKCSTLVCDQNAGGSVWSNSSSKPCVTSGHCGHQPLVGVCGASSSGPPCNSSSGHPSSLNTSGLSFPVGQAGSNTNLGKTSSVEGFLMPHESQLPNVQVNPNDPLNLSSLPYVSPIENILDPNNVPSANYKSRPGRSCSINTFDKLKTSRSSSPSVSTSNTVNTISGVNPLRYPPVTSVTTKNIAMSADHIFAESSSPVSPFPHHHQKPSALKHPDQSKPHQHIHQNQSKPHQHMHQSQSKAHQHTHQDQPARHHMHQRGCPFSEDRAAGAETTSKSSRPPCHCHSQDEADRRKSKATSPNFSHNSESSV